MSEELFEPIFRKFRVGHVIRHINKYMILCDIGCGDGSFLKSISKSIKTGYGFDKKITDYTVDNIYFKKLFFDSKIPLDDSSVDCVTLIAVLEHIEAPDKILTECNRILKKNGKIMITTPAPMSKPILEFLSYRLNIVNPVEIMDHKHYFSKNELVNLLKSCGFKDMTVRSFEIGLNNFALGYKD